MLLVELTTFVAGRVAIVVVADGHPPATAPAQRDALQECGAFAHGAAMLFGAPGSVVVELLEIVSEL